MVDDLHLGWERARNVDLKGERLIAASLGTDEVGQEQLLIVTGASVRISNADDDLIVDEALDRLRTQYNDDCLVLYPRPASFSTFDKRWVHISPSPSVDYLGKLIDRGSITSPTDSRGSQGRAIPDQGWRMDRLAHLVGLTVIRAAEAEHNLSISAGIALNELGDPPKLAGTGEALVKRLRKAHQESGNQPLVISTGKFNFADLADRYEGASSRRNQLVHSVRPMTSQGDPGPNTHRLARRGASETTPYEVATQDLPEIVALWCVFDDLAHDAQLLFTGLVITHASGPSSSPSP